jgi:hypothetical protein
MSLDRVQSVMMNRDKLLLYTGIPSPELFAWLIEIVKDDITCQSNISIEKQLLIVLTKFKLNVLTSVIALDFDVSRTAVRRIFDGIIPILATKLKFLINWPSKRALKKNLPECFKNTPYKNAVSIIDCTEVTIQRPGNQAARSQTWSNYKHSHTIKFLVGTTPSGSVSFLSKVYGGRASDKLITLESGFLNKLAPGDIVLADRGFILEDHFLSKGAKLVVPSFTLGRKQLSKQEIYYSKSVSNVRIHVERVIRQIKRYRILQGFVPIKFLKYIDDVIIIVAAVSNLSPGIV